MKHIFMDRGEDREKGGQSIGARKEQEKQCLGLLVRWWMGRHCQKATEIEDVRGAVQQWLTL